MERILIVEDERPMRTGLENLLTQEGYRVLSAPDGEAGLAKAIKEKPDLWLLDIMMPKLRRVRSLRRTPEAIPFDAGADAHRKTPG